METITTIALLRARLSAHRRAGKTIGLVPTMGYLHVGHMELVARARAAKRYRRRQPVREPPAVRCPTRT